MKKTLNIIFEQLPSFETGGLVTTYVRLVPLLQKDYHVRIVSVFAPTHHDALFSGCEFVTMSPKKIDLQFFSLFHDLKNLKIGIFLKKFFHLVYFFLSIPFFRNRMKRFIKRNDTTIVTCPVAGMFMPKHYPFIMEIHIYYEYFFGKNLLGNMQAKLMQKPSLTLFRTKRDSDLATSSMNSNYIYNFLDNTGIIPVKKTVPNRIIYLGRLSEQKDPLHLIELAKKLKDRIEDFIFDIYGTGDFYEPMLKKIKEYHLEKQVFLKGFNPDRNLYKNYSVLWMTSKFEGLSLVMIEAKANGIPIICTPCGDGLQEVIHDTIDGFIIDDDNQYIEKTLEIFQNKKLRDDLSRNSFKDFERFSKEQAEKNWQEILTNFEHDFLN